MFFLIVARSYRVLGPSFFNEGQKCVVDALAKGANGRRSDALISCYSTFDLSLPACRARQKGMQKDRT